VHRIRCLRALTILVAVTATGSVGAAAQERPGFGSGLTPAGRKLDPVGRLTTLGAFPTGGALTPDGRFYWAVDAGRGTNAVRVVRMDTGAIAQTLPIPGGYVGVAFAPDGRRAYVSGQPAEGKQPEGAKGTRGDVIHVYDVDVSAGTAAERDPIVLPDARDGAAAADELPPASGVNAWPEGLTVMPDGKHLVVALGQADQVAIVELATGNATLAGVGRYPYGVVADPTRSRAYVSNERDGTVSVVEIPSGRVTANIQVGGDRGSAYAHPEGLAVDPTRDRLYVAVTDRDLVAVIDTQSLKLVRALPIGRQGAEIGSAPVAVAVAPDGGTLYVANAGEDAVAAVALVRRPLRSEVGAVGKYRRSRSVRSIGRYRVELAKARRVRDRAGRSPAARRRYSRPAARLRRTLLTGALVTACGGPRARQDRAYGTAVLRAYRARDRARRQGGTARRLAQRRFTRAVTAARRRLRAITPCLSPGALPGTDAYTILGRLPTAAYTTDVEVTPDGKQLVWLAAKGLGTGPNPAGESIKELLKGRAGVLRRPTDRGIAALSARAERAIVPTNAATAPVNTPIVGPGGGPSEKIEHLFYIVRENRTYDQIFGADPRGVGDPRNQLFDDNGVPGPAGGVTPNAHALSRRFSLLDSVYANSEESTAGHKITAGGYANDYVQRYSFTNRGRKGNPDIFPIGIPPNAFVFDQAVRQSVPFRVYGEFGAGNQPFGDDGRATYDQVQLNTDLTYPSQVQGTCRPAIPFPDGTPLSVRCTADSGEVGGTTGPPAVQSRTRSFATAFQAQLAAGTVPRFNYLILFNDHTDGTTPGVYTPKANMADNDLALGQVVELISQSSIWERSPILVVEDDSQDGIDSVDAHRIPAFVLSPYAKRGGQVISTRYDHYSFLRTAEMIVGLRPLSLHDSLATPLYDAFISGDEQPDVEGTRYTAIQPQQPLTEVNPPDAPNARLSASLPWDRTDYVPQRLADRILWQSVYGPASTPPPPGPGASPVERARAVGALARFRAGRSVRGFLLDEDEDEAEEEAEEEREQLTDRLLSAGRLP
jgi:DNA-binding beta-propeller fold protein YncE